MSSKNEGAKVIHELAVETRKLLKKSRESEAPQKTDRKTTVKDVLTTVEVILDESSLTSDEICQVLNYLKIRYATGPE